MNPALIFIESNIAEGRIPLTIEVPLPFHKEIIEAGYSPQNERPELPGHIVITDTNGLEWCANLPAF